MAGRDSARRAQGHSSPFCAAVYLLHVSTGGEKKKKIMQSPVLQMGLAEQALVLRGHTGSWARDVPNGFAWSPALLQPCSGKGNGIECSRNALL